MENIVIPNPALTEDRLMTGEEFFALGEDATMGLELVNGKIVGRNMPTGDLHGAIELRLGSKMLFHIEITKSGKVRSSEVGFYISRNPDSVRAADILYISNARYAKNTGKSYLDVVPELIAEIMSPSDTWDEVTEKLEDYFSCGVQLVWIIHPKSKRVHVYRSLTNIKILNADDILTGEDVLEGFSVKVADLFE